MTLKIKNIAVVTGTRAEYGILKPLLKKIKNSPDFKLELVITGMHLLRRYGLTIKEIEHDGFKTDKKVIMYDQAEGRDRYYGESLARGIKNFTKIFLKIRPDILIVLGDRLEPLAAALAAANLVIPIIHLHGGEKTDSGHIDESIRHALTRFSHIHLVATKKCRERLLKMGEESWRIFNVGALGLDSILNYSKISRQELFKKFKLDYKQKFILFVFHPVFNEAGKIGRQTKEALSALEQLKLQSIIIYPNNDAGAKDIIKEINKYKNLPFIKIYPNLNHEDYAGLLNQADILLGNSSSGIIEAPSLKLAVVNIGLRNTGREHADNVIFVKPKKNDIVKAVSTALVDKKFKIKLKRCRNPYGDGKTAARIIKILKKIKLDKKLMVKLITY